MIADLNGKQENNRNEPKIRWNPVKSFSEKNIKQLMSYILICNIFLHVLKHTLIYTYKPTETHALKLIHAHIHLESII